VTNEAGESRAATTYRSPQPGGPFSPTAAYTRPILAGARELGLDPGYIAELEDIVAAARAKRAKQVGVVLDILWPF